jgi:hypothetical protein
MADDRNGFTGDEAARLLKLKPHQIADLVDRGFLKPSVWRGRRGPKGSRLFSLRDLVTIRSAHELIRIGVVGDRLRRACRLIGDLERRGRRHVMLLVTHAGDVLHVANRAQLGPLLRQRMRPVSHVVLDVERISREVGATVRRRRG